MRWAFVVFLFLSKRNLVFDHSQYFDCKLLRFLTLFHLFSETNGEFLNGMLRGNINIDNRNTIDLLGSMIRFNDPTKILLYSHVEFKCTKDLVVFFRSEILQARKESSSPLPPSGRPGHPAKIFPEPPTSLRRPPAGRPPTNTAAEC